MSDSALQPLFNEKKYVQVRRKPVLVSYLWRGEIRNLLLLAPYPMLSDDFSDAQVQKYIDLCHQAIRKQDQGLKETYQNMFRDMAI